MQATGSCSVLQVVERHRQRAALFQFLDDGIIYQIAVCSYLYRDAFLVGIGYSLVDVFV